MLAASFWAKGNIEEHVDSRWKHDIIVGRCTICPTAIWNSFIANADLHIASVHSTWKNENSQANEVYHYQHYQHWNQRTNCKAFTLSFYISVKRKSAKILRLNSKIIQTFVFRRFVFSTIKTFFWQKYAKIFNSFLEIYLFYLEIFIYLSNFRNNESL